MTFGVGRAGCGHRNPASPVLVVGFGTTFSAANLIDRGCEHSVTGELTGSDHAKWHLRYVS